MTTPILGITELAGGQTNQYAVVNAALRALEAAANAALTVNLTSGNDALTAAEFAGSFLFVTTGNTVSRSITVPAAERVFAVRNGGSATLDVICGSTTLTVAAGKTRLYYTDGTANGLTLLDFT